MASCLKDIEMDLQKEAALGAMLSAGAGMIGRGVVTAAGKATSIAGKGLGQASKIVGKNAPQDSFRKGLGTSLARGSLKMQGYGRTGLQNTVNNASAGVKKGIETLKQAYKAPVAAA